jgi:hypothetical protein
MPTESEALDPLVTLLARERALFRPFRSFDWSTPGAVPARSQLQRDFRQRGLPWTVGGDANARKASEKQITELREAGLIESSGRTKARRVQLTNKGRQLAESLAGVPRLEYDSLLLVRFLLECGRAGRLISELLPSGLKNYDDADAQNNLWSAQCGAIPAVIAGWLQVESDCHGRVAYKVTPAGEAAAKAPDPKRPDVEPVEKLVKLFWDEYNSERDRLLTLAPTDSSDIGPIRLSAGLWDAVIGPWNWPPKRKRSPKTKAKTR